MSGLILLSICFCCRSYRFDRSNAIVGLIFPLLFVNPALLILHKVLWVIVVMDINLILQPDLSIWLTASVLGFFSATGYYLFFSNPYRSTTRSSSFRCFAAVGFTVSIDALLSSDLVSYVNSSSSCWWWDFAILFFLLLRLIYYYLFFYRYNLPSNDVVSSFSFVSIRIRIALVALVVAVDTLLFLYYVLMLLTYKKGSQFA